MEVKFLKEEQEFVKNVTGLINLNKTRDRQVLIGFQVLEIIPKPVKAVEEVVDVDDEDPLKDLPLPEPIETELIGWYFFPVASTSAAKSAKDRAASARKSSKKKKGGEKGSSITINMLTPPLLRNPYKEAYVKKTSIELTFLYDTFIYDMDSLNYFVEQRLKKEKEVKDKFRKIKPKTYDTNFKEAFIVNDVPQYTNLSFHKGSGIDIYVDACRFLPDNVTVTKIIVRFVNCEFTDVLTAQGGRPELDSDIYNPTFNFRQELRAPNYDPTLMMYITYITFDERGKIKQPRILGYSMFNVFVNRLTGEQPRDRKEQAQSQLHDGLYQIPIYCQPFKKETPFYVDSCQKYDKLPASSTLIRVRRAPVSDDGLKILSINTKGFETKKKKEEYGIWVVPPKYSTGAYNSKMCGARQSEIELAEIRRERKAIESKDETLVKLKPIYKAIKKQKAEEAELLALPEEERKKRLRELKERRQREEADIDKGIVGKGLGGAIEEIIGDIDQEKEGEKEGEDKDKKEGEGDKDKKDEKDDKDKEKDDKEDKDDKKDDKKSKKKKEEEEKKKKEEEEKKKKEEEEEQKKKEEEEQKKKEEEEKKKKKKDNSSDSGSSNSDDDLNSEERALKALKRLDEDADLIASDDEDTEYVYKIIDTVFTYRKNMDFLNLKFFSKYREDGGFKFIIDGIHNLPKNGFYVTTYGLNPPGGYYAGGSKEGIKIYTNFDWERSTTKTIRYNEGYVKYSKIPFDTGLHFVVELSTVSLPAFREPEIKKVAWSILPIFVIDKLSKQGYVNSNIYQLPLFAGSIDKNVVLELQCEDPWEKIVSLLKSKKIKYWNSASVFCRLLDIQREGHFQEAFDYMRASEELLPESRVQGYRYYHSDDEALRKKKAKMLSSIIPYKEDPYSFNKRMSEFCFKEYDIEIPDE